MTNTSWWTRMRFVVLAGCLSIFLSPLQAYGYITTNQQAVELSDTAAIFTITYTFGGEETDFYMPIMGERGLVHGDRSSNIGYALLADGDEIATEGDAVGVALGSAAIENGWYHVPAGSIGTFTFIVLYTVPDAASEEDYALQFTQFPFLMGTNKERLQLNVSELHYYVTPEVSLNDV